MSGSYGSIDIHDFKPALLGALCVLLATSIVQVFSIPGGAWTTLLDIIPPVFVVATIFYSLKSQKYLGGEVGRNLSLVATGIALYGLVFHLVNIPYQIAGSPVLYGLSSSFWLTSTHTLQIFGITIAAYGFYRMWRSSQ